MQELWWFKLSQAWGLPWLAQLRLPQWAVFGLAGLLAVALAWRQLGRQGLCRRSGAALVAASLLGGALLGHLVAVGFKPGVSLWELRAWLSPFRYGISSMGVYAGAALGMAAASLWLRKPFWAYADAMAPGMLLAAALARCGCLLHGCDFGLPTTQAWGLRYPRGSAAFTHLKELGMVDPYGALGLPMHPMPLYEALPVALLGLLLLRWPWLLGQQPGQRAAGAAALYCALRALSESFRAQASALTPWLSVMQLLCLIGLVLFAALWWRASLRTTTAPLLCAHEVKP